MELDALYGTNPDLNNLPMYCIPFSHKNWYDAKDMRSTGGNDVNYAMDVPKEDSPDIANLRDKGAIIYATGVAASTGLTASGPEKAKSVLPDGNYAYGVWGGQACNPYDTERVPRGTSSGSGVSVSANLVVCSICEQGSASCKGPASRNDVVNVLTTKGLMMHGGMNSQRLGDRAGIHCRTVKDAAMVLDAVRGFESKSPCQQDVGARIPNSLVRLSAVVASFAEPDIHSLSRVLAVRSGQLDRTEGNAAVAFSGYLSDGVGHCRRDITGTGGSPHPDGSTVIQECRYLTKVTWGPMEPRPSSVANSCFRTVIFPPTTVIKG